MDPWNRALPEAKRPHRMRRTSIPRRWSRGHPVDGLVEVDGTGMPWNGASKAKIPPSDATSQYPHM